MGRMARSVAQWEWRQVKGHTEIVEYVAAVAGIAALA